MSPSQPHCSRWAKDKVMVIQNHHPFLAGSNYSEKHYLFPLLSKTYLGKTILL